MYHHNLLAAERSTWALTQAEVGSLLGMSGDAIGNYELAERTPSLPIALGLGIIFGKSLTQLFPDLRHAVAANMLPSAQLLSIEIERQANTPAKHRKQEFLAVLGDRLASLLPEV